MVEGLWLHLCLCVAVSVGQLQNGGDEFKVWPVKPGPWVHQTRGEIWPKPKVEKKQQEFLVLQSSNFRFEIASSSVHGPCDIIDSAISRYYKRVFPPSATDVISHLDTKDRQRQRKARRELKSDPNYKGFLETVQIVMNNHNGCQKYPQLDMDEQYEVRVNSPDEPGKASIIAFTVWGILRGMESFSQLVYSSMDFGDTVQYLVNGTQVLDSPRFSHRGVLIDTSRHYISKAVIKDNLDLMEMNKYNVFHWHITDDPSFPYVSKKFPELSKRGAWHEKIAVYTQEDVAAIVEYARERGIRVISEFDTPGHTQSFEPGQPGLLTECYTGNPPKKTGEYGPFNPTKKRVYTFVQEFFEEITQVFPDKYLHLGGDEVDLACWASNPEIQEFMDKWNLTGDYHKLENIYIKKLLDIVSSYPTKNGYIVWQEVFDNGVEVKNDTIIHVWKGQWDWELSKVTRAGLRAILSSPWYLNYISYGSDWTKFYLAEPLDFFGDEAQKKLVLGGEACMWGEFVNSVNLTPRLWPRASAVAERLWSQASVKNTQEAKARIQEMECRMLQRGFPVEPINGPAFCDIDWNA